MCWLTFCRHDQTNCLGRSHYSWSGCSCPSGSLTAIESGHHFLVSLFPMNPSNEKNSTLNGMFTLSDTENDICSETDEMAKISQWHQMQALCAVWSALHTTVELIIIVVGLGLGIVQCEQTIRICVLQCMKYYKWRLTLFSLIEIYPSFYQESFSVFIFTKCSLLSLLSGLLSFVALSSCSSSSLSVCSVSLSTTVVAGMVSAICFLFRSAITFSNPGVWLKFYKYIFNYTRIDSIPRYPNDLISFQCQVPRRFHQNTYLHNSIEETRVSKVTQPFNFGQYYTRVQLRIMFDWFLLLQFRFFIFGRWTVDGILRWIFSTGTGSTW